MDIAIVADDLTGAADAAVMFAGGGRRVEITLTLEAAPGADVLAVDTASRERSPAVGAYRVFKVVSALAATEAPLWYKKLDSTLRGNVTSELDAFLRAAGSDSCVVAPAYPAQGRTTRNAVQQFDDAAMGGAQRHDLAALLAPLGRPLIRLGLADVHRDGGTLRASLGAVPSGGIALCDALTDSDLDRIAAAALERRGARLALAGSAGLAAALRRQLRHDAPPKAPLLPGPRRVLVVVGTRNPVARRQLAVAEATLRAAARPVLVAAAAGVSWRPELTRPERACDVTVLASPAEHCTGDPRDIAHELAREAAALVPCGERRLFITGGEAARAVLDELGVTRLAVRGAVADGMPALNALDGVPGLEVVTKAGGFGADDALMRAITYLRGAAR